jgi:hypothetical protein
LKRNPAQFLSSSRPRSLKTKRISNVNNCKVHCPSFARGVRSILNSPFFLQMQMPARARRGVGVLLSNIETAQ